MIKLGIAAHLGYMRSIYVQYCHFTDSSLTSMVDLATAGPRMLLVCHSFVLLVSACRCLPTMLTVHPTVILATPYLMTSGTASGLIA